MRRNRYVLAGATIAWIGIVSWVVTVYPQGRGQVPAAPGQQAAAPQAAGARGGGLPGTESGWSSP
jgi:hypothetical protein